MSSLLSALFAAEPPPPRFEEPWRGIEWGNKVQEMEWLNSFQPENSTITHLRILLYGPAGSGKSSFINSVDSVCQTRITSPAMASNSAQSFTVQYKTHRIKKGKPGQHYPFVFNDLMGLEVTGGAREEDIKLAIKGHVRDGYKFNAASPIDNSDWFYNNNPDTSDKVNILVCVLNANAADMPDGFRTKMRNITMAARDCGIPQIAILTRIDEACPLVKKDVKDVYHSKFIKNKMEEYHGMLGIPLCAMFPVKNYHEKQEVDADMDMLILKALKQMILQANDYVNQNQ